MPTRELSRTKEMIDVKTYTHDLSELKRDSRHLIEESRKKRLEGDSDYADFSILDYLEEINENPDLVTTGSCSGHDGFPFVSVVFKDDVTAKRYVRDFREMGYVALRSDKNRMQFFEMNYRIPVHEEITFGPKDEMSREQAAEAWRDFEFLLVGQFCL